MTSLWTGVTGSRCQLFVDTLGASNYTYAEATFTVTARHNFLRVVDGQGVWLDKNCESHGSIELTGACAHWWILQESVDRDSGHVAPGGHIAALYQNELYKLIFGRAGLARLQGFGVIFGTNRVVIYVESQSTPERPVASNTARTQLLIDGEPLDWAAWAAEFREKLPDDIVRLQEEIGSQAGERDHKKAILERLKQIKDLLRFSRFRPAKDGTKNVDPEGATHGGEPATQGGLRDGSREGGKKDGRAGDIYALFAETGGTAADPVESLNEPRTQWVGASSSPAWNWRMRTGCCCRICSPARTCRLAVRRCRECCILRGLRAIHATFFPHLGTPICGPAEADQSMIAS